MRTCFVIVHKATQLALPTVAQMTALGFNVGWFKIEDATKPKGGKWEERCYLEKSGAKTGLTHYLNSRNKVEPCSLTADDFEITTRKISSRAYFELLGTRGAQASYENNRKAKKQLQLHTAAVQQIGLMPTAHLTPEKLADLPIEFEWD